MLSTLSDPGRGWGSDDNNTGDAGSLRAEWNIYLLTYNNRYHQEETLLANQSGHTSAITLDWYMDLDIYLNICRSWTRDEGSLQKGVGVRGYPFYRSNQA